MYSMEFDEGLERICPLDLQEEWDNCGLQIDVRHYDYHRVLVALEITDAVIEEAIEKDVQLIIVHHPMFFSPIKNIRVGDTLGFYATKLIKHNISVYACHTNFDKMEGGNNDYLGKLLQSGQLQMERIEPFNVDNGFCRKGNIAFPYGLKFYDVINKIGEALNADPVHFRAVGEMNFKISTIGWCTGAGTEFMEAAKAEDCDLFITGDLKYHEAQKALDMGLCILDIGHYGSEIIFVENMANILREICHEKEVEIIESTIDINPFKYAPFEKPPFPSRK